MTLLGGIVLGEGSGQFGGLCHESELNRDRVRLGLEDILFPEIKQDL